MVNEPINLNKAMDLVSLSVVLLDFTWLHRNIEVSSSSPGDHSSTKLRLCCKHHLKDAACQQFQRAVPSLGCEQLDFLNFTQQRWLDMKTLVI